MRTLLPTRALAAGEALTQALTDCPSCGRPAAAHVSFEQNEPVLVRLVCAAGCADDDSVRIAVIDALYGPGVA